MSSGAGFAKNQNRSYRWPWRHLSLFGIATLRHPQQSHIILEFFRNSIHGDLSLMNRAGLAKWAAVAAGLAVVATGGWATIDALIHSTSGPDFCGQCHTMGPMVEAYSRDVHGGRNEAGFAADCTDCHLPHDGSFRYLIAKAETGLHDVWAELTYDLDQIDWVAKRAMREHFVYDSGCLRCHSRLEQATSSNSKAFVAHKPYFLGTSQKKCVFCHGEVGHADLEAILMATPNPKTR
jgi:cytochrome c-type protein NapC